METLLEFQEEDGRLETELRISRKLSLPIRTVRAAMIQALTDVSKMRNEVARIQRKAFCFVASQMAEFIQHNGLMFPAKVVMTDEIPAEVLFHAENIALSKVLRGMVTLRTLRLLSQAKRIDPGIRDYLAQTIEPFHEIARSPLYGPGLAGKIEPKLADVEALALFVGKQVESFLDDTFLRDYSN